MNFSLYIAKRYLISKKSRNIINIISTISVSGVAIGTMALIVILSVHNGFEGLMNSLFNSFDPDLKITIAEGKSFSTEDERVKKLKTFEGVAFAADVIEEIAVVKYDDKQYIATLKGVSDEYVEVSGIDSMVVDGDFVLKKGNQNFAVVGEGVAYYLSVGLGFVSPLIINAVRRSEKLSMLNPEDAINRRFIHSSGIFKIQPEFDVKYIIVPLEFAASVFEYEKEISAIEIKISEGYNYDNVQQKVKDILGPSFEVQNRDEQHEFLHKTIESEKWVIFLILAFVLLIASFNIVGSLTMLIIDKKRDIAILRSLGASLSVIRKIFLMEGWLISILGALIGLILGLLLALGQQEFGWIKLQGSGSFIIDAYPVDLVFSDFVVVLSTVLGIGFVAAWYPIRYITRKYISLS